MENIGKIQAIVKKVDEDYITFIYKNKNSKYKEQKVPYWFTALDNIKVGERICIHWNIMENCMWFTRKKISEQKPIAFSYSHAKKYLETHSSGGILCIYGEKKVIIKIKLQKCTNNYKYNSN